MPPPPAKFRTEAERQADDELWWGDFCRIWGERMRTQMSGNVPTLRRMDSGRLTAGYNHTTSTRDENSRPKWTIGTSLEVTAIKQKTHYAYGPFLWLFYDFIMGFYYYYAQPTNKVLYKHQWVTQMPHQKESFSWKPHIYNLHGSVNQYLAFFHHLIPLTNNILDKLSRAPVKQIISPK